MRYLLKLNGYKWSSLILLIAFFVVACASYNLNDTSSNPNSLEGTYQKILDLDKIHNGTFRTEVIPKRVLRLTRIDPLIGDLEELKLQIKDASFDDEVVKNSSIALVEGRTYMLEAQKALQLAVDLGPKGIAQGKIDCMDVDMIKNATYHYNQSAVLTGYALGRFDKVLSRHKEFRDVLGVNDDKIMFYNSEVLQYKKLSMVNDKLLKEACTQ